MASHSHRLTMRDPFRWSRLRTVYLLVVPSLEVVNSQIPKGRQFTPVPGLFRALVLHRLNSEITRDVSLPE